MKKSILILLASTSISGCGVNAPAYSPAWWMGVSQTEVEEHFNSMPVYELCITWEDSKDYKSKRTVRKEISKALIRKGEDPLKCDISRVHIN